MAWTYYSSNDASAPALNTAAGGLVTVLDAILVNGYGSKAAAGWTIAYTGTNQRAYRVASGRGGTQYYYQFDNTSQGRVGVTRLRGYQAMTSVTAGTTPILPSGTGGSGIDALHYSASYSAASTVNPWICVADGHTCAFFNNYMYGQNQTNYTNWVGFYIGAFASVLSGDAYDHCMIADEVYVPSSTNCWTAAYPSRILQTTVTNTISNTPGHYLARDAAGGGAGATPFEVVMGIGGCGASITGAFGSTSGPYSLPSACTGSIMFTPLFIRNTESSGVVLRGKLRGLWGSMSSILGANTQAGVDTTWAGTGDFAGKTFTYAGYNSVGSIQNGGHIVVESSNTVS